MDGFEKQISGFYYDQQMSSSELTARLYPNQVLSSNLDSKDNAPEWVDVSDPDDDIYLDSKVKSSDKTPIKNYIYSKTPIAVAIINEDFSIDIANQWTDFGGDAIGQMWNQNRAMAPYLGKAVNFLSSVTAQTDNYIKSKKDDKGFNQSWGSSVISGIKSLANTLNSSLAEQKKYLSRALIVQGTRFSYYGGTGINVNNLNMKYTIFPEVDSNGEFVTVYDKLQTLIPYVVGDYIPVVIGDNGGNQLIKEFASWQLPPGGFEADIRDVDVVQKGTLKLRLGSYYFIDNLVISGCQFQMSKQMVKNPSGKDPMYSPLFCEVALTLKPATKYSRDSLNKFVDGNNSAHREFTENANKSLKEQRDAIGADMTLLKNAIK